MRRRGFGGRGGDSAAVGHLSQRPVCGPERETGMEGEEEEGGREGGRERGRERWKEGGRGGERRGGVGLLHTLRPVVLLASSIWPKH